MFLYRRRLKCTWTWVCVSVTQGAEVSSLTKLHTLISSIFWFQWATLRMERVAREKNQQLYKPYCNGKNILLCITIIPIFYFLKVPVFIYMRFSLYTILCLFLRDHSKGGCISRAGNTGSEACGWSRGWVWHVRHSIFLSARSGEHRGWRGDQTFFGRGAGVLEPADAQQLQLQLPKY